MICPGCGNQVPDGLHYCIHCGTALPQGDDYRKDRNWNNYIVYIAICAFVVLLAGGGLLYLLFHEDKPDPPPKRDKTVTAESSTDTPDDPDPDQSGASTVDDADDAEEEELSLPYTDNQTCAIYDNLSREAFESYHDSTGDFSFSYPKYLFNNFTYNPDKCEYYFYYENNGEITCSMRVYREEDNSHDAVKKAAEIKRRFAKRLAIPNYWWPHRNTGKLTSDPGSDYREPRGDGYSRYVMSGWLDSEKEKLLYMMGANDGSYSYYLEFEYPEYDTESDMEDWDYIVECIYRKCSFSGTNYYVRSYQLFKSEGYGEGHH